MSYFIFTKNADNLLNTLYRICENQSDFDNLNIFKEDYKIIESNQSDFDNVKYGTKSAISYNNNTITFIDLVTAFPDKIGLRNYINAFIKNIKNFTDQNPNHPLFNRWNDYYNQLNNIDLINISLNQSLEQSFKDLGQTSLNPLQLP